MKRIIVMLLALMLALSCCAIAEEIAEPEVAEEVIMYVTGCGALGVFEGPGYDTAKIGSISGNMPVSVIGEPTMYLNKYAFVEVSFQQFGKEVTGYVNCSYLAGNEPEWIDYPTRTATQMSLRTEPGAAGEQIVFMPTQTPVTVRFYSGHWAYVNAHINGKAYNGFCYNKFFTPAKAEEPAEEEEPEKTEDSEKTEDPDDTIK